jgi:hypothetical protein
VHRRRSSHDNQRGQDDGTCRKWDVQHQNSSAMACRG